MSLKNYGVLVGRPIGHRIGAGATPHYQIHLVDETTDYRIAINVKSKLSPSELQYLIDDDFHHPIVAQMSALARGFHAVPSQAGGLALDFIRGNLFDRNKMRVLPADVPGPDNDLNDEINRYVQRAMADENALIYAFGQRWGPENKKDNYFGFSPGNGIHDIHMNQGNSGTFVSDDGVWQDGAMFIRLPASAGATPQPERWIGIFLKFQSQAWHTDDKTGHTISDATPQPQPPPVDTPAPAPSQPPPVTDGTVRIIAALVNPTGPAPEAETVTLLNTTPQPVALDGWALADRFKNKQTLNGTLAAGATLVINVQTPVQLGNQGGIITLLNAAGLKMHGVSYTAAQAGREGWTLVF